LIFIVGCAEISAPESKVQKRGFWLDDTIWVVEYETSLVTGIRSRVLVVTCNGTVGIDAVAHQHFDSTRWCIKNCVQECINMAHIERMCQSLTYREATP